MGDIATKDFTAFLEGEVPVWIESVWSAIEPVAADYIHLLDVPMMAAFLAGGLAMMAGARLALLGAILLLVAHTLVRFEVLPASPDWVAPAVVVLLVLGAVQGVLTLFLGEQTAGTVLFAALLGTILFVIWRGPAKLLRLLGLVMLRKKGRW